MSKLQTLPMVIRWLLALPAVIKCFLLSLLYPRPQADLTDLTADTEFPSDVSRSMTPEQKAKRLLAYGLVKAPKWLQGGPEASVRWVLASKPKAYWA